MTFFSLQIIHLATDIDIDMTSLIQGGGTKRGRPAIIDNQHFSYVSNGPGSQKVDKAVYELLLFTITIKKLC